MTLQRNEDGSHTFTAPNQPYVAAQDAFGRTAILGAPSTHPPVPVQFSVPQNVRNATDDGFEYRAFSLTVGDIRGTWQQQTRGANFKDASLVGDAPNDIRHAFKVVTDSASSGDWVNPANLTTTLYRMVWASFKGVTFTSMGIFGAPANSAPVAWRETSAVDPTLVKVATYTPNANSKQTSCMAVVSTGGQTRLWIGYGSPTVAAMGIEAFDDATLTPAQQVDASDGHTGTVTQLSGIIQAPNGDILIAIANGDLRVATNNTAALAAISFTNVQTQALGFYPVAVGNCSLSNYAPGALWWCSSDAGGGLFFASENIADITPRGRLILSSFDGLQLDPIDFPDLPYVTFATIYRGGVVACDRKSHYWYTGRRMIPMDGGADRPVDSHKSRLCCGHGLEGDKFLWLEAELDDRFSLAAPDAAYDTVARIIEFDPYREQSRPISKALDLGYGGGSLIVGATPSLPVSPETGNLHAFYIHEGLLAARGGTEYGHWLRQYQPPANTRGSSQRSTDLINAGGQAFEENCFASFSFQHPDLDGFVYRPVRATGPATAEILKGGTDAYIKIDAGAYADSAAAPQRFSADDPDDVYPVVEFGVPGQHTWRPTLDVTLTSHQGTGATHMTPNVGPVVIEVLARRPLKRVWL